jgi:diaminopimelate epimerase
MRSSTWDALGNCYLVYEGEPLTPERVRALAGATDGILEVTATTDDSADVTIWNPDGSTAELSGNGTRIAACWLAAQTGADTVTIRVGPREMVARMLGDGRVEQAMGTVEVLEPETIEGLEVVRVSVGNPHAVAAATHGEGEVTVRFPGGDLDVRLADGRAWLTGPAARRRD